MKRQKSTIMKIFIYYTKIKSLIVTYLSEIYIYLQKNRENLKSVIL